MSQTITIRLSKELADWLARVSATTGVPQGKFVRDQLERAKASDSSQLYMRLAGTVRGRKDLSRRKGFTQLNPRHSVVTVDRSDFRVYRRNKRDTIPLITPPEL